MTPGPAEPPWDEFGQDRHPSHLLRGSGVTNGVHGGMTGGVPDGIPDDDLFDPEVRPRPYLVTGGRTRTRDQQVSMETVVVADLAGRYRVPPSYERGRILAECVQPVSVAEIAARLRLPLTVALVLVDDLVAEGLLLASSAPAHPGEDVAFIERLIAGVSAL